jgi:hypothetical protein
MAGLLASVVTGCLPVRGYEQWRGNLVVNSEYSITVTATGIAPELHRTSLLIPTVTVGNQIGANVGELFLAAVAKK